MAFPVNRKIVEIVPEGGAGNTVDVVKRGIEMQAAAEKAGQPFIHVYCVFDKDDWDINRYQQAFIEANKHNDVSAIWATATDVIDFAKKLLAFQEKVDALSMEWEGLENVRDAATPEVQEIVSKRFFGRRKRGEITSMPELIQPLLETLVEMGGSGKLNAVLDRIGEKMEDQLKPKDLSAGVELTLP
jgi:hypothetical protein